MALIIRAKRLPVDEDSIRSIRYTKIENLGPWGDIMGYTYYIRTLRGCFEVVAEEEVYRDEAEAREEWEWAKKKLREQETKTRFYPNGAIMDEPGERDCYWSINSLGEICVREWYAFLTDHERLRRQNVFLTKKACEKYADILKTYYRVANRIHELNHAGGGLADWSDCGQQKCHIAWDYRDSEIYIKTSSVYVRDGQEDMLLTVAEQIQKEFSLDELKKFLKIMD
jgi:hypothetical protein